MGTRGDAGQALAVIAGLAAGAAMLGHAATAFAAAPGVYGVVIRNGLIYDGSGGKPFPAMWRSTAIESPMWGRIARSRAAPMIDAHGQAVAPGFIDMMGHSEESLLIDGRAVSGLKQGVTLDVFTEQSKGPLNPRDGAHDGGAPGRPQVPGDLDDPGPISGDSAEARASRPMWRASSGRRRSGSMCSAKPTSPHRRRSSQRCAAWCTRRWKRGRLGLTTALIYAPMNYAKTPELIAMAQESARCGGIYTAHMRSEGDHIEEAVQETIDIARASGAPAEIHHLKLMGRENWGKLDRVVGMIDAARASGVRITADMYTYTAGGPRWMPPCRRGCMMAARKPWSRGSRIRQSAPR